MGGDSGSNKNWARKHLEKLKRERDESDQAEPVNNGSSKRRNRNQSKTTTTAAAATGTTATTSSGSPSKCFAITIEGDPGSVSSINKTVSKVQPPNENSIPKPPTEVDTVLPKSKMFEVVKELIKMDTSMEEGIGMAINVLDNFHELIPSDQELNKRVTKALSQAREVQHEMKMAKEKQNSLQNNLQSALVKLLFSSCL